ncbi:hypothetical protein [Sulfitobacter sp.]|uniref:hypothetical protein n=1 Tax=Sulfitobacter sp. TaxID=1903071 RepID=UPI0025DDEFB3|nr:hypothetical protein [Sulfitobacter sp.]
MPPRTYPFLIAIFALAGCETNEQRFARLLPAAEARCGSFGHKTGSAAYATCLQSEVSRLEDKEDQAAAAIAASFEAATPTSTTCYTSGYGYTSTTTCY